MQFIEFGFSQQTKPPYEFKAVEMKMFLLNADLAKIQNILDTLYNVDPDHHFRAMCPYVYLCVNYYPKMLSLSGNNELMGYTTQREYYFMIPVLRTTRLFGNFFIPVDMTWIFPFIGVDNFTSAMTGVDVLGFGKVVGTIDSGTTPDGAFSATVAMPGFTSFTPESVQQSLEIIRIRTGPAHASDEAFDGGFPFARMAHLFENEMVALIEALVPGMVSMTNYKQIRDGERPDQAAYAAMVRCEWRLEQVRDIVLYDNAEVQIEVIDNASLPITATLGLDAAPIRPIVSMGCTGDMWFGNIRDVFVAP